MRLLRILAVSLLLVVAANSGAGELTPQEQLEIIESYMYVTGQRAVPADQVLEEEPPPHAHEVPLKCGMPAVYAFVMNRDKLDPALLKQSEVQQKERPDFLDKSFPSDSGRFLIHYTDTGGHAVYKATEDSDGDGVPNYVEGAARIFDSVFHHHVTELGYPEPPADSFYPEGGDARYDVYLLDLGARYYGLAYPEYLSEEGGQSYTSYVELDNDYRGFSQYEDNPLDAVRVTAAHEYFHAIHFTMDAYEGPDIVRSAWMEISAVWMEEETYDHINDYYNYLRYYFEYPLVSLQRFETAGDYHPYGSGIFGVFLSEKYGRDIIRDIWQRCADVRGPNFVTATDSAVRHITGGADSLAQTFGEFALWNYFTGDRSAWATHDSIGYQERWEYPEIPDWAMLNFRKYPFTINAPTNPFNPDVLAATYANFLRLSDIKYLPDTLGENVLHIGAGLGFDYDSIPWVIHKLHHYPSPGQLTRDYILVPGNVGVTLYTPEATRFDFITMIFAPVALKDTDYEMQPSGGMWLGLADSRDTTFITRMNVSRSRIVPYPNPYVCGKYTDFPLHLSMRLKLDDQSDIFSSARMIMNIFNVVGELVRVVDTVVADSIYEERVTAFRWDSTLAYTAQWDTRNEHGREVASGAYLIVGQMYSDDGLNRFVTEATGKVAIIR